MRRASVASLAEVGPVTDGVRDLRQVRSFPETLDAASDEKLRELVALLVERVETADRQLARVVWTAPARPFFAAAAAEAETRALWGEAPPDGFEPPTPALGRLRSIH